MTDLDNISVLYVEDDDGIRSLVTEYLEGRGITVHGFRTGQSALLELKTIRPDVIVLDIMLPDSNGYDLCETIRDEFQTPIIFMSALDEENDRILGLDRGGDDYITKPFSSRELLARIQAHARRFRGELGSGRLVSGAIEIDRRSRTAFLNGESLVLTSNEFTLLLTLVQSAGRALTREQLVIRLNERGDEVFERAIDVQISRLRTKLGDDSRSPIYIKTVRGVGYIFSGEPSK